MASSTTALSRCSGSATTYLALTLDPQTNVQESDLEAVFGPGKKRPSMPVERTGRSPGVTGVRRTVSFSYPGPPPRRYAAINATLEHRGDGSDDRVSEIQIVKQSAPDEDPPAHKAGWRRLFGK